MNDLGALKIVAAFASLGAAGTHVAVAPGHFGDWPLSGAFFFATAVFQAGWTLAVMRGAGSRTMTAGLLVNAASIGLWALSRTAGLPVGPHAGMPERVDRVDLTTVGFEAVVCVLALWCLSSRHARGFRSSVSAAVVIGAAGAAVAGFAVPAIELAGSHSHGQGHETTGESVPHSHGPSDEHPSPPVGGAGQQTPAPAAGKTSEPAQPPQPAPSHSHAPGAAAHDD